VAQREFPAAERDFARALELDADYEPALREAGYGKLEQRDYAAAAEHLARAVKLDPVNAATHLMLGVAYLEQQQREAAERSLKQALKINPLGAVRAHIHLANLYSGERRYSEAVSELQIYLTYAPNAPDAAQIKAAQEAMRARIKN
jgi:Tfp pilus assembly protein PilF